MPLFDVDDKVETHLGVGRVVEVRCTAGEWVYLVEIQPGGFGRGLCDVFIADEMAPIGG